MLDRVEKIVALMSEMENLICGFCSGCECGEADCMIRFAEQAKKIIDNQREVKNEKTS